MTLYILESKRISYLALVLFFSSIIFHQTVAQNMGNSPYSTYGMGDINTMGSIRNIAMGNTQVANHNAEFLNLSNPALLPVNKGLNKDSTIKFTMLDFALFFSGKNMQQGDLKQSVSGLNLAYFTFLFPISKNWVSSVDLRPYSSIDNRYQQRAPLKNVATGENVADNTTVIEYFSQGSINQVTLGNGVDISKNISLGLNASYLFGSVNHQNTAFFNENTSVFNPNKIGSISKDFFTAFQLKPGVAYRAMLKNKAGVHNGMFLNIGATFSQILNGSTKRSSNLIFVNANQGQGVYSDTLQKTNYFDTKLPYEIASGISLEKTGRWTIAADFSFANWSVHKDIYGQSFLKNSISAGLGFEWKPAKNLSLKTWEYRAGFSYTQLPLVLNNTRLNDLAFSLGATVPVGRKDSRFKSKPLNKINLAVVLGTRGTTNQNLVKENYIKLNLGVLIQDKWFQRWKID
jgi:hypothetical protein